jgi:hypothetical protein
MWHGSPVTLPGQRADLAFAGLQQSSFRRGCATAPGRLRWFDAVKYNIGGYDFSANE